MDVALGLAPIAEEELGGVSAPALVVALLERCCCCFVVLNCISYNLCLLRRSHSTGIAANRKAVKVGRSLIPNI